MGQNGVSEEVFYTVNSNFKLFTLFSIWTVNRIYALQFEYGDNAYVHYIFWNFLKS